MLCPLCKQPLVSIGRFCYEDCLETRIYSDEWSCATPGCECHTQNSYWNDDGDFFSGDMRKSHFQIANMPL